MTRIARSGGVAAKRFNHMAIAFTRERKPDGLPRQSPEVETMRKEPFTGYSIELITREEELSRIENVWNHLSDNSEDNNIFASFDWFCSWNHHFLAEERLPKRQLNVLVLKKGRTVTGIVPFIFRQVSRLGFSIRKIEFTGPQADYNDLLVGGNMPEQGRALALFLANTQDQWDLVDLRDVRDTQNSLKHFAEALEREGLPFRLRTERERYPHLRIDAPWAQWLGRQSYGSRRTLRNQQSKLARSSSQGLRVRLIESPHLEAGLLNKLIVLEKQKRVRAKPLRPFIAKYSGVFQSLFDILGPRGTLLVALMELGEQPLAWQLWFRCGRKLWMYQTAYSHAHARLSPGTMLVPAVMDYAFERGYTEMDFLRGEEPYKMRWANDFHQTFRLEIWSRRWKSRTRKFVYLDLKDAVYQRLGKGD